MFIFLLFKLVVIVFGLSYFFLFFIGFIGICIIILWFFLWVVIVFFFVEGRKGIIVIVSGMGSDNIWLVFFILFLKLLMIIVILFVWVFVWIGNKKDGKNKIMMNNVIVYFCI